MATVRVGRRTPLGSTSITRTTAAGSLVEHHLCDRQAVQAVIHGLHYQAIVLAADATRPT
jgi:hypothetical protein